MAGVVPNEQDILALLDAANPDVQQLSDNFLKRFIAHQLYILANAGGGGPASNVSITSSVPLTVLKPVVGAAVEHTVLADTAGPIPAGSMAWVVNRTSGTVTVSFGAGGSIDLGGGSLPRSFGLTASQLTWVQSVFGEITISGGTYQWVAQYPVPR